MRKMQICRFCGGELLGTVNPAKLQCRDCGRVFKNYKFPKNYYLLEVMLNGADG